MSTSPDAQNLEEGLLKYAAEEEGANSPPHRQRSLRWQNNFLAFLIPLLILALAYAVYTVFPFGDRHILTVDLFHQYAPFMAMLRRTILSGESILFTFSGGLGMNLYSLFAYYLASPLNILLLAFPETLLSEAVFVLTLIKVGFAGLAFHLFLKETFQRRGAFSVIFGAMYALSAFVMAYSWNIMWLDALILLPLVLWALTRFIKKGKFVLYIIFLALLLLSNYYAAFFACLFMLLYFPILMSQHTVGWTGGRRFKVIIQIIAATVIAVALTAFLLLPAVQGLQHTSASGDKFPATVEFTANPLAYLAQHFMLLEPTIRSGYPNLYSGVGTILLLPIFFMSTRIRLREKLMYLGLMLFMILSFDLNILNFLWHGMHFPNQLPYRNSFVYIFLVLTMAYSALRSLRDLKGKDIVLLTLPLVLAVPISVLLLEDLAVSVATQWATIIFLLLYMLVFAAVGLSESQTVLSDRTARTDLRRSTISSVLILLMLFELLAHSISSVHFVGKNEYFGLRDGYAAGAKPSAIRAALADIESNYDDGPFYRVEINKQKSSNDPALYGYNGLSMFASTSAESPVKFFENMGYYSNGINSYKYTGSTLFLDSLFGIEFLLAREPISHEEVLREQVMDNGEVQVYQNPYALPLGFAVNSSVLTYKSTGGRVFQNQNRLAKHMFPELGDVFTELTVSNLDSPPGSGSAGGDSSFNFYKTYPEESYTLHLQANVEEAGTHYLYYDSQGHDMDDLILRTASGNVRRMNDDGLTELGFLDEGEHTLELTFSASAADSGNVVLRLARIDETMLEQFCVQGNRAGLEFTTFRNDQFSGNFESPQDGVLLLTIPYDPGWIVWIDGEIQENIRQVNSALMAIPITAGEHRITMRFWPEGLSEGLLISAIALAVFVLVIIFSVLRRKRRKQVAVGEYIASDEFLAATCSEGGADSESLGAEGTSEGTYLEETPAATEEERDFSFDDFLENTAELREQSEADNFSDKMEQYYKRTYSYPRETVIEDLHTDSSTAIDDQYKNENSESDGD